MIDIRQLSLSDDIKVYEMLQRISPCENEFKNTAYGLTYDEFQKWLIQQDSWSRGENLPDGYVAQTVFWLFDDRIPVGFGKIRHSLTEKSMEIGGNIGYAIDPIHRGKGYATILLCELIKKADVMGVHEKVLTVEKYNPASKRVIEKAGGHLTKETDERWYFEF